VARDLWLEELDASGHHAPAPLSFRGVGGTARARPRTHVIGILSLTIRASRIHTCQASNPPHPRCPMRASPRPRDRARARTPGDSSWPA
jgi:hypothetical protein